MDERLTLRSHLDRSASQTPHGAAVGEVIAAIATAAVELAALIADGPLAGITGRVFNVRGGHIGVAEGWHAGPSTSVERRWDTGELGEIVSTLVTDAQPNADMRGGTNAVSN